MLIFKPNTKVKKMNQKNGTINRNLSSNRSIGVKGMPWINAFLFPANRKCNPTLSKQLSSQDMSYFYHDVKQVHDGSAKLDMPFDYIFIPLQNRKLPNRRLIVFFHGNADCITNVLLRLREQVPNLEEKLREKNLEFLSLEYPGYTTGSVGSNIQCSEHILLTTYPLMLHELLQELGYLNWQDVILIGYSIGTGPATYIAHYIDKILSDNVWRTPSNNIARSQSDNNVGLTPSNNVGRTPSDNNVGRMPSNNVARSQSDNNVGLTPSNNVAQLILMAGFTSLQDIAKYHNPFLFWLMKNRFLNRKILADNNTPNNPNRVCIVHGKQDAMIPKEQAIQNYLACLHRWKNSTKVGFQNNAPKLRIVSNAGHTDLSFLDIWDLLVPKSVY